MSHKLDLDTREIRTAYIPRHGRPDPLQPVEPPAWASEHARPVPALVGEAPTRVITTPVEAMRLPMPLPSRVPQADRRWQVQFGKLGRALTALRPWGRR